MKAEANTGLSREFVIKSIADYLETAEKERRWVGVSVLVQDGRCRTIKEERTTTREAASGLSREFVIKSIADYLEIAEKERRWGGISVLVQEDGRCRTIKEERTITREAAYTK